MSHTSPRALELIPKIFRWISSPHNGAPLLLILLVVLGTTSQIKALEKKKHVLQLEDILPPQSLILLRTPDMSILSPLRKTALGRMYTHPEAAEFSDQVANNWESFLDNLVNGSAADRETVESLLSSQFNLAFIGLDILTGKQQGCLAFTLPEGTDSENVFLLLKELARHRLSSHIPSQEISIKGVRVLNLAMPGVDHFLFKEENLFTILDDLLILTPNRSVIEGMISRYQARGVGVKILSQEGSFRAVKAACQEQSGGGFIYVNNGLLLPVLTLFLDRPNINLINSLGLQSISHIGLSLACHGEGIQNSLYLHTNGVRGGILKAIASSAGAENYSRRISADNRLLFSAQVNLLNLYRELPPLLNAIGQLTELGAQPFAFLSGNEEIFGVPASDVLAPLGDFLVIQQTTCGTVFRFPSADCKAFEKVIGRIESNLGGSFTAIAEGPHLLKYYNQFEQRLPLAPSYMILGRSEILLSTHPQAIKAALRQPASPSLAESPRFVRAQTAMPSGLSILFYSDSPASYPRVYNASLPLLNVFANPAGLSLDPGLLPPGDENSPLFFGYSLGVKTTKEGITITGYSPVGVFGIVFQLIDDLFVNNPAAMGLVATTLHDWFQPPSPRPSAQAAAPDQTTPKTNTTDWD